MKVGHVPGYDVCAHGWRRSSDLMVDPATIIPVGKKVLLSSLCGWKKVIQTSIKEIYPKGYKILLEAE